MHAPHITYAYMPPPGACTARAAPHAVPRASTAGGVGGAGVAVYIIPRWTTHKHGRCGRCGRCSRWGRWGRCVDMPAQHAQLGEGHGVAQPRAVPLGLPQQLQRLGAARVRGQHVPVLLAQVRRRAAPAHAAVRDLPELKERDRVGDGVGQSGGVQQPLGSDGRCEALRRTCRAPRPLSPISRLELP